MIVRNRRMQVAAGVVALVATLAPLSAIGADRGPSVFTAGPTTSPVPSPAIASPSPGPSATEPAPAANTERPLTAEELLALRSMSASTGGQVTVVATASIARDVPIRIRAPACGREMARRVGCFFGVLEPTSDRSGLILVWATPKIATLFPADDSPVQGTLAFAIDGGNLKLLGPVDAPSGSDLTPVEEGAMAGADALQVGRLIAVDGWLGVLGLGVSCPREILGKVGMSSAFVRCPAGWIAADGASLVTGPFNLYPPGFAIPVQAAAYDRFAPNPAPAVEGATPPRRAVYLLSHVANPLPEGTPATGWRVIGRLDPVVVEEATSEPGGGQGSTPPPLRPIGADPPLRDPVVPRGPRRPFPVADSPTARGQRGGVVLELWLPERTIHPGRWLTGHIRITNNGRLPIFLGCYPTITRYRIYPLFPAGRRWAGNAAAFKRAVLDRTGLGSLVLRNARASCPLGETGNLRLRPGDLIEYDVWDLPRDIVRNQPLPGGTVPVITTLSYDLSFYGLRPRTITIRSQVELAGSPWLWASPQQIVDAALEDPRFADWLARRSAGCCETRPSLEVVEAPGGFYGRNVHFVGPAPDGTILFSLYALPQEGIGGASGNYGQVLLDPWTAQVIGFTDN